MGSIEQQLPIDVLVIGTGLAGLTAALECHRKGMRVRVLERNATINTAGDMFFMGLSSTRFFKHWPEMRAEFEEISIHNAYIETFKHSGEVMIPPMRVADRLRATGLDPKTPPGTFQMRPLIYRMFVNQLERCGIEVLFGKKVVGYYEDEAGLGGENIGRAGVVTEGGERFAADVVIAADGVGSKSQGIVGGQVRAISSGRAMWRAAFPIECLDQNPKVKEFFNMVEGQHPIVRTFLGPGTYALTLTRPDVMIWIMNHDATTTSAESWTDTISPEEVLAEMDDDMPGPVKWAPIFKDLVKCTPDNTIINFELLWRNPQPSWSSCGGRVIQIGDAAHSFLPASGNGATQAIEDGISLATCLQMGGKERIADSVGAHVRMRFVRTACAQKIGFSNADLLQQTDWDKVKVNPRKAAPMLPKWIWSHDPEAYAQEHYWKMVVATGGPELGVQGIEGVEENYPRGYRFDGWCIEDIMEDKRKGRETSLGEGVWLD